MRTSPFCDSIYICSLECLAILYLLSKLIYETRKQCAEHGSKTTDFNRRVSVYNYGDLL